ncbi:MAG: hydantoinase B/oxoprolinase family protein [Proteobacteria bacterium]|nr:hydantoinase B/oxoprolinase family protein [Pseudomonadota bacterium]
MDAHQERAVNGAWHFLIDRGGTFTDIIARAPDGTLRTLKILSEAPGLYSDAAIEGIRRLLGLAAHMPLPRHLIGSVRMGTTVATNALLQRRGTATLLLITAGFADALRIAYQNRPELFARRIVLPPMLYRQVAEVTERLSAQGEVLRALDEAAAQTALRRAWQDGLRSVAIVLMHGYRYPQHELRLKELAYQAGFTQVSASHEVSPLPKLVGRGDTTVADACLSPVVRHYAGQLAAALGVTDTADGRLLLMQSSGGLADWRALHGRNAILSGPAGGIVGMARTAQQAGFTRVIGFDMGGTSTDVSHFAGEYERTTETVVAGVRIRAPMMHIHTVAAGGGSVCSADGARLRVGPASAGAHPGPACYRRGGPLTVTDCNLLLGRLQPAFFPRVFGPAGHSPLNASAAAERLAALTAHLRNAGAADLTADDAAAGCLRVAVASMANAIKRISVERGHDVTTYALACFGGAGGQHACAVADALGMRRILIHRHASLLSALGMGLAQLRAIHETAIEAPLSASLMPRLEGVLVELERRARRELEEQGALPQTLRTGRRLQLRYAGADAVLTLKFDNSSALIQAFAQAHRAEFGFEVDAAHPVLVAAAVVEVHGSTAHGGLFETAAIASTAAPAPAAAASAHPMSHERVWFEGARHATPLYDRGRLLRGQCVAGPALILDPDSTTVVEPGWTACVDALLNLVLERASIPARASAPGTRADPVLLEIFNGLFMAVAEQMGVALQNTARSVNIRERLDFSCAVFDGDGALIANAPHMPVHLGSMGESVRVVIAARAAARDGRGVLPGDAYMLNAPWRGGTHLPDITVIMPVFLPGAASPAAWVAARGHHADIGGITPGSMPPLSRSIEEEGVLIDNFLLVDAGRLRSAETLQLLASGRWPARNPRQNLADLQAQVAACARGAAELRALYASHGAATVQVYMEHVLDYAAEAVRRVLDVLHDGSFGYELDNGALIRVTIRVNRAQRSAVIDFGGTSPQLADNFNAPPAICRAAVLYVFRTLVAADIPLNDGCLRPLTLVIPAGSMLSPQAPAAVVAGNVETSQAVIDALYGALGVMAAACGTMSNLTFGDGEHQYYETIAGGSGAGPDYDGASAVQTHATNSLLTDPEILEARFPVLLDSFRIRRGSGGSGAHRGGDGSVRRLRFRAPMTAAILSNRRRVAPFGIDGGGPGATGRNALERADGTVEELPSTAVRAVVPGDVFVVETPGGGGYGESTDATPSGT